MKHIKQISLLYKAPLFRKFNRFTGSRKKKDDTRGQNWRKEKTNDKNQNYSKMIDEKEINIIYMIFFIYFKRVIVRLTQIFGKIFLNST
jgi:hypothetical protein